MFFLLILIWNEWNKIIFCFRTQCVSGWHINIDKWCQYETLYQNNHKPVSLYNALQSTPALRTPRYYGHPAITDSSKIPGESYRRLTEINSRYYGLSLLRTYGHFIRSQRHNFIVFSLVIADTEQHLGIFAHISSLFFLLFETVFVFFGRFPLLLSISQNSLIFFS